MASYTGNLTVPVWAALRGHGSYPANANPKSYIPTGKDKISGNGPVWNPAVHAGALRKLENSPWRGFGGAWGARGKGAFPQWGPEGPNAFNENSPPSFDGPTCSMN